MQQVTAAGINLDEGIAITFEGALYQGAVALHSWCASAQRKGSSTALTTTCLKAGAWRSSVASRFGPREI